MLTRTGRNRRKNDDTGSTRVARILVATVALIFACDGSGAERLPEPSLDSLPVASPATPDAAPESRESASLRTALEVLVRGASAPDADSTWFTARTADVLRSATVNSVGHAIVDLRDLRPLIPNASSSAGSTQLLSELNNAVFSVAAVRTVEYQMNGNCDLFWEWLQYSCHVVTRESAAR